MASSIPSQARAVDPFASYNSNTVNTLTRMLTYGYNGIATPISCDVTLDSTSNTQVVLSEGFCYMDDMWIHISASHIVDFTDPDHYYLFDTGFDEPGIYYIVLEYTYVKSRPAPNAKVKIVKPSQRNAYSPYQTWLFLKAVKVEGTGPFYVTAVYNKDPENIDNRRLFVATFAGGESYIPTHQRQYHLGRVVYSLDEDDFYFGLSDRWFSLSSATGSSFEADTSSFELGDIVYVNFLGTLTKAVSTLPITSADGVVGRVGNINGVVQTTGKVSNIKAETGEILNVGSLLYLSKTEPGTVTTQKPTPISQFVGRCLSVDDSTSYTILFHRGEPEGVGGTALGYAIPSVSLPSGSWNASGGLFYQDVDLSGIEDKNAIFTVWDATSGLIIQPENIEFISDDLARIWMPINTIELGLFVVGPPQSTVSSSNIKKITTILPSGVSWIFSGPLYYQEIDVSSLDGVGCAVNVKDTGTGKQIFPADIEFVSSSIVRIWMPVNTESLEVVTVGASSSIESTITLYTVLSSGSSWTLDSGLYYQDIDTSLFSTDDVVMEFYDINTDKVVFPSVEFLTDIARVWMPDNTHQLNVTIIG